MQEESAIGLDRLAPATEVTFNHFPPHLITFTPSHRQQSVLIFHALSLDKIPDCSLHRHLMRSIFLNFRREMLWSEIFVQNEHGKSSICDYYGKGSYPKTLSWNMSRVCCLWDGVKCDKTSGQVIELDISCSLWGRWLIPIAPSSSSRISKRSTLEITTRNHTSRQIDDFNCIF